MSESRQVGILRINTPVFGILVLAAVFATGLFLVAFDQGHLLGLVYGEQAFDERLFHEFSHDLRHAAGFPCH